MPNKTRTVMLLAALPLCALVGQGCVREYNQNLDEPIREFTTRDVSDTWAYTAEVGEIATSDDEGTVPLRVRQAHPCEVTEHRVVDRTKKTVRKNRSPGGTWALGIAGTACAGLAAGGLSWHFSGGEPFVKEDDIGLKGPGAMTVVGGLCAAPMLISSIVTGIRSIDTTEHVGEVEETETEQDWCDIQPASEVQIELQGDSLGVLGTAQTDEQGRAEVDVDLSSVFGEMNVHVEGTELDEVEGLDTAHEKLQSEARRRQRERTAQADRERRKQEIETGKCSDTNLRLLQRALQTTDQLFLDGLSEPDSVFRRVGHEYIVATPDGAGISLRVGSSGEYHVYAIGLSDVQLKVTDPRGNPATTPSRYARVIHAPSVDSRAIRTNVLDRYDIEVKGRGCTLVVAYERF